MNAPLWTHKGHKGWRWRKDGKTFIRCYIRYKYENMTPLSQKCGEKQQGSAFKDGPHLSFLKSFQY